MYVIVNLLIVMITPSDSCSSNSDYSTVPHLQQSYVDIKTSLADLVRIAEESRIV